MSAAFDVSRVKRGQTAFGPTVTITAAMQAGIADWLGTEKWVGDSSPSSVTTRSKRRTLIRFVKNSSGVNLKPKRLVRFKLGTLGTEVDGYTHVPGQGDYAIVDEFLPAAGVRNGDYFWVVIRGPSLAITNIVGDATGSIAQGSLVMAATGTSSQNDTNAGRVAVVAIVDPSSAALALANHEAYGNAAGRAMSGKTSSQTDADILVDIQYHS